MKEIVQLLDLDRDEGVVAFRYIQGGARIAVQHVGPNGFREITVDGIQPKKPMRLRQALKELLQPVTDVELEAQALREQHEAKLRERSAP